MKRKFREVELTYYNPAVLTQTMEEAGSDLTWEEMIENIELGYKELIALLKIADKADLGIPEIICLYLYYWEELPGHEIAKKVGLPNKMAVSRIIETAKEKLHPSLIQQISLQNV